MTDKRDDFDLDGLFDAARRTVPAPSDALMARVLADGLAAQQVVSRPVRRMGQWRMGLWRAVLDSLGGWPTVAGLATAGVAGLWLGINPPAAMSDAALVYLGGADTYALEMAPALDFASADTGIGG